MRKTTPLAAASVLLAVLGACTPRPGAAAQESFDPPGRLVDVPPPPGGSAQNLKILEGFRLEHLYTVRKKDQGSWVSLTSGPGGHLFTSDQAGKLYRITPGKTAAQTTVERLDLDIGSAQGLLWAHQSLYVMVNGKSAQGSGLYRCRDTDGDGKPDSVTLLRKLEGAGEHGPHAVRVSPDGKGLLVCAGNHTNPPKPLDGSRVPQAWDEDQLIKRMPDGRGHATGRMAPGGWIARTDPDGKKWELFTCGFRNLYDIAVSPDGDVFTYDSDMEWDMNLPWYRPTRVCLCVPGADYGWRYGNGKWPAYYPDTLPSVVDIGPGSPTGIEFGTLAKFPAKYQKALFISDWSYGKIYAVHLRPKGASYAGAAEEFIRGAPFPIADIAIHPDDGAMYLVVGGRNTQSGLYRVTYAGRESTARIRDRARPSRAVAERRACEAVFMDSPAGVKTAWPRLSSPDRFIRYAARVALEHQDPKGWQDRALAESDPVARIQALIALARVGNPALQSKVIAALDGIPWAKLDASQRIDLLRAYGLAFIRLGKPDAKTAASLAKRLDPHYPSDEVPLNLELCRMMCYLQAPTAAAKTVALLENALTQEEQVHYVVCLRTLTKGWTPELRRAYLGWFVRAAALRGGNSFTPYVANIKKEAVAAIPDDERKALDDVINAKPQTDPAKARTPRPFVKKWTVEDLAPAAARLRGRSFKRGREMFGVAGCFACHRVGDMGGSFGPILTGVGGRFSPRDLLESIIEPSKTISDQYEAVKIQLNDGTVLVGRIINLSRDSLRVNTDMRDPNAIKAVDRKNVRAIRPSDTSMMPEALLDTLKKEEILDLLAYLISGGDPGHGAFK